MRILLSLAIIALLTGCVNMPTYDPNEYALANSIGTISEITQKYCSTDKNKVRRNVEALYIETMLLKNYTMYRPNNAEIASLVTRFAPIVEEFHTKVEKQEEFSTVYCVTKLQIMNTTATSIQEVLGNKPNDQ